MPGTKSSGNRSSKPRAAGAGRPPKGGTPYGVPMPLDVLFAALGDAYGDQAAGELKAVYDAAQRRYQRAQRLVQFERDVRRGPRTLMTESKLAYRRAMLADPLAYINGEETESEQGIP